MDSEALWANILGTPLRTLANWLAGGLIARGLLTTEQGPMFAGIVIGLATLAASIYRNHLISQRIEKARDLPPATPSNTPTPNVPL